MPLKPFVRRVMSADFHVLLRVALLAMLPCAAVAQDGRTALPQVRSAAVRGSDAGEVAASQKVPSIAITLKRTVAQQADLDAFLTDVRTKGSSQYHQWLTPDAFAKRFAPSSDAVAQVTTWLQSQGLQVNSVAAGGMRLNVSGTAQQTETAFAVSLHRMALTSGDAVSVTGTPSVPNALAGVVESVSGLDVTATSTDTVAALADSVDANTSAVLTADLTKTSVSAEELTAVLEQAAAQGQTIVLSGASSSLVPERALLVVKPAAVAADDSEDVTPRPDWQAAQGLPTDGLRATPDAAVTDVAALASGLTSVTTTSGRQGEIAARFYQVAPEPGVFTHADSSVADGTWNTADGLGTVDVAKLVKALAVGSTNPLSSVLSPSSRDVTHGQNLTLTVTITGGSGTPTGTITFASAQGGTLGSAAMTNGVATYSTSNLAGGQYGFYGTYSGDSTYAGSTTNVDTVTIGLEAAKVVAGVNGTPLVGTTMAVSVGVSSPSGVGTPSGTVTVWPYGTAIASSSFTGTLGASTSAQATASVSVPATNAGTFNFQANCTTDASFSCYSPTSFSVTVGKGAPAMKLTQTGTSTAATLTATVTAPSTAGTGTVAPTGSVQFLDNGTAIGNGTLNSSGVATYSGALGSGTTHAVTATYGGDGNYNTATATANATTKVTPSVVLAVVTAGTSLSATVTPPLGTSTIPTGTVQFLNGSTTLGTATLNSSGVATYTGSYTSGVGYILTAVYAGDTNFNTATSNAIDTSKITPTVTLTKTASSATDATVGLSAAVTSTSSTVATGTVAFMDGSTKIGSGALSASGVATFAGSLATSVSASSSARVRPFVTSTVTHTLTAVYGGDTNFNSATSNAVTADATTTLITTSTALTSSSGYTGAYGTSFTLNVVVTPSSYVAAGTAPSGTVTISDASGVVGTGTLSSGSASIVISTLSVGSHALTATYSGDTNYAASTSSPAVTITITSVTATITATISPTGSVPYGYNATITVNASASSGSVAPAGTVTATVSGNNGTYTGTLAATGTGATTSTASISFPVPPPGKYTITITCNTNITCNTASVSLTTTQGYTKTTITGAPSSPQAGVPVSISATVANSGTGTGTYTYSGTVSFYAGNKYLGKGAVANGVATASVTFTSATTTSVTAVYSGDTNWSGSTSDAITVVPLPLDAVVSVTSSTTNGIVGQNITLTATATSSVSTATLVPSGTVTFYDTYNGVVVNLGSASLLSNGLNTSYAALSTTGLRAGSHSIVAMYSGDTAFNKETAAAIVVNMGDFALSFLPASTTVSQGGSAQINVVVSGVNSFSGMIALGCTPPAGTETTCSITPASVTTGSSAVMTINTTKATTSSKSASRIAFGSSAVGVFALLLMGGRRRRVAALFVLLLAVGLMSGGCGEDSTSSNGGGTTDSGTPLGTLTFQVVGAAVDAPVAARHTASVSVTVQ
ncbi:Ig-like domain repeat protein [Terriglobus sp. ADX1]|uniref:Ig-like domain repeat protein n=1 Tax=Terriglobus sp. ADX1 TaxID=2794063 RepID=UPI002FE5CFCB